MQNCKKFLTASSLGVLLAGSFVSQNAEATAGACSGHGGFVCSWGEDTDGSVVCLDGWRGSSVQYTDMQEECGENYVTPAENQTEVFSDVSQTNKNRDAILYLNQEGIIGGYSNGTFKPVQEINRAELLKILVGATGAEPTASKYGYCFTDVTNQWFAPYVCYGKEVGWIDGYSDGSFKPAQNVNKVEAVKMILNSQGIASAESVTTSPYTDVSTDAWFAPYVVTAEDLGLLEETGQTFGAAEDITRGGVSEVIYRAMVRNVDQLTNSYDKKATASGDKQSGQENSNNPAEDTTVDDTAGNDTTDTEDTSEDTVDDTSTTTTPEVEIASISPNAYWTSWDSDAEKDGFELSVYFKDENGDMIYPQTQDWTATVKIYNQERDDSFQYVKKDLIYNHSFEGSDMHYKSLLGLPFVRIDKDDLENATGDFGWVEITLESPTYGTYSAYSNYVRIR